MKTFISGTVLLVLYLGFTAFAQELELKFNAAETESMLFLFNQTTIKGSDVEVLLPLNKKLKDGLEKARVLEDKEEELVLKLTPQEIGICLNIINNATFEARYAELVFGMKKKLQALQPVQGGMMQMPAPSN
ncbi:hypothetical protein JW935_08035 [candidate division KSB1 bacterium]|nr:hypothetical protein [candidate division KSB1 bacterium]